MQHSVTCYRSKQCEGLQCRKYTTVTNLCISAVLDCLLFYCKNDGRLISRVLSPNLLQEMDVVVGVEGKLSSKKEKCKFKLVSAPSYLPF